jgi:transcriptional regulator with XRE-family HTH domain
MGIPPGVTGRTLRYVVGEDGRIDGLQQAAGMRERIGEQVRAGRIAAGLSQAELARRIGVTPSALSQVERGRHGLSGETLTRLWATLGIPFGPTSSPSPLPYRLARRGARQPLAPAPGLSGETVLQEPSGLGMHELTFPAGGSGRRPFEPSSPSSSWSSRERWSCSWARRPIPCSRATPSCSPPNRSPAGAIRPGNQPGRCGWSSKVE